MGRGGGRSKASGGTVSQDSSLSFDQPHLNISLWESFQSSYFEKDLLSYCANRLAEYSCVYMLSSDVSSTKDTVDFNMLAYGSSATTTATTHALEFSSYPSHFIKQREDSSPGYETAVIQQLTDGEPLTGTFLGPLNVRDLLREEGQATVAVLESHRLPVIAAAQVLVPPIVLLASLANILTLLIMRKFSRAQFPIAIYLVYLTTLEQVDLTFRGIDYFIEAFGNIRLFTAVQFLSRSSCQLLLMTYNVIKHLHSILLLGFGVECWKFTRNPSKRILAGPHDCTRNLLIFSVVVVLTTNGHFLWTFDINKAENKILHERVVRETLECGFSATWTLSTVFSAYIWPILDHGIGEFLPLITCGVFGVRSLYMSCRRKCRFPTILCEAHVLKIPSCVNKKVPSGNNNKKCSSNATSDKSSRKDAKRFWLNVCLIQESLTIMPIVCITYSGIMLLPVVYYLTKFTMFAGSYPNRGSIGWKDFDIGPKYPSMLAMKRAAQRAANLRRFEVYLEAVEMVIRLLLPMFILIRAIVLTLYLTEFRRQLIIYRDNVIKIYRRCRSLPTQRQSSRRQEQLTKLCISVGIPSDNQTVTLNHQSADIPLTTFGRAEVGLRLSTASPQSLSNGKHKTEPSDNTSGGKRTQRNGSFSFRKSTETNTEYSL